MRELKLLNHLMENVVKVTAKSYEEVMRGEYENLDEDFSLRGKMIDIISTIIENLSSAPAAKNSAIVAQFNNQLNQLVDELAKIDQEIVEKLEKERSNTQIQIAKTFKNKENFKGYNLNNIK